MYVVWRCSSTAADDKWSVSLFSNHFQTHLQTKFSRSVLTTQCAGLHIEAISGCRTVFLAEKTTVNKLTGCCLIDVYVVSFQMDVRSCSYLKVKILSFQHFGFNFPLFESQPWALLKISHLQPVKKSWLVTIPTGIVDILRSITENSRLHKDLSLSKCNSYLVGHPKSLP